MTFRIVNGITVRTLTSRQGLIPLVFINSLGTDLGIWDGVVPHLAHRYHVIRYDKRGHGLSEVPPGPYTIADHTADLSALLDDLGIEAAVLVGISVGGLIALDYAAAHPERVRALVLCDTGARIGSASTWNERIGALKRDGMAGLAETLAGRWVTPAFREQEPAAWRGCLNLLTRTPLAGYIATCEAIRDADLTAAARTINVPTLVLCGESDQATPPESGRALAGLIAGAQFDLIRDAAHLPCLEQPGALAERIDRFLAAPVTGPENGADRFTRGMATRRAVLGDEHVDRAIAQTTPFDADFQRFITEYAWGTVWGRPALDRLTRHLLTLAILAALGKEKELAMHIRATENTGVTPDQLREVFMQVAVYAGIPAANRAFALAKAYYNDHDLNEEA